MAESGTYQAKGIQLPTMDNMRESAANTGLHLTDEELEAYRGEEMKKFFIYFICS